MADEISDAVTSAPCGRETIAFKRSTAAAGGETSVAVKAAALHCCAPAIYGLKEQSSKAESSCVAAASAPRAAPMIAISFCSDSKVSSVIIADTVHTQNIRHLPAVARDGLALMLTAPE